MSKKPVVNWAVIATVAVAVVTSLITLNNRVAAVEVRVDERRSDIAEIREHAKVTDANVAEIFRYLLPNREPKQVKPTQHE